MIKFINAQTGGVMYVADHRVDEYIKAGHKIAPPPPPPAKTAKPKTKAKQK